MGEKEPPAWLRSYALFGVIVSALVVNVGVAIALGYFAYSKLGAPVWVIAVLGIVGLIGAMVRLVQLVKKQK